MKSRILNYFIDAVLFVIVGATGLVGAIIGYVIPDGSVPESRQIFLGLQRSEWAGIHAFLSVFLLALIVLHLLMNAGWVIETTKKYFGTFWLKFLGMLIGGWVVVLMMSWFAVKY